MIRIGSSLLRALGPAAVLCLAAQGEARAQEPPGADDEARNLFLDGRSLMDQRRWDEARPKLERSEQLRPGKGTEFNLAECYEHLGRPAAAWTVFERVAAESKAAGMSSHEALARQRADAVALRVPKLTVDAADAPVDGLEIRLDGLRLSADVLGQPLRVEPGTHHLAASAPLHAQLDVDIDLSEGESRAVRIPPLAALVSPAAAPPQASFVPPPEAGGVVERNGGGGGRTMAALILGGTGTAAIITGGIFVGLSLATRGSADQWCNPSTNACTSQRGVDTLSTAVSQGNIATGFLAAGATLLAAGAVLWWTSSQSAQHATVGLWSNPAGEVGIVLRGRI
jgi:hypothetical protein